uniref:Uncharacterized protein n=1 Tax=Astyanax mexicanus TaxID=7994 RepID=A0A3B1IYD6_ASTMX
MNLTKSENKPDSCLNGLNRAGVKTSLPQDKHIRYLPEHNSLSDHHTQCRREREKLNLGVAALCHSKTFINFRCTSIN